MKESTMNVTERYSNFLLDLKNSSIDFSRAEAFRLDSGTTIISAFYDSGKKIILAGDRKAAYLSRSGDGVSALETLSARKIYAIDTWNCFGGAGMGTFIFRLGQELPFIAKRFEQDRNYPLSSYGIAGIMRQFSSSISMRVGAGACHFVLCGIKPHPVIFNISAMHVQQEDKYCIIGSGSAAARPIFGHSWRANMNEDEIINLTLNSLMQTMRNDVGSGWDFDNAPMIMLLRDTLTELPEKEVRERLKNLSQKFQENRGGEE